MPSISSTSNPVEVLIHFDEKHDAEGCNGTIHLRLIFGKASFKFQNMNACSTGASGASGALTVTASIDFTRRHITHQPYVKSYSMYFLDLHISSVLS